MTNIHETTFKSRQYLALRKDIALSEITNKAMYDEAGKKLYGYVDAHHLKPTGAWSVLYFKWNEPNGRASIAVAVPIEKTEGLADAELSLVDVPESKAVHATLSGNYDGLKSLHESLMAYTKAHSIKTTLTVEEYTVGPVQKPDPKEWVTNVYYLHG
jgi:effector-binding domain-containing protein